MTFQFYPAADTNLATARASGSSEKDRFHLYVTQGLLNYVMREYRIASREEAREFIRLHLTVKDA